MATVYLSKDPSPCFVCDEPTKRLRSMTLPHHVPKDANDQVRICLACDEDWTEALVRERIENPPKHKPKP